MCFQIGTTSILYCRFEYSWSVYIACIYFIVKKLTRLTNTNSFFAVAFIQARDAETFVDLANLSREVRRAETHGDGAIDVTRSSVETRRYTFVADVSRTRRTDVLWWTDAAIPVDFVDASSTVEAWIGRTVVDICLAKSPCSGIDAY